MDAKKYFIGIDVGGTKIAAGVLRLPGAELTQTQVQPTEPTRGGRAVLDTVLGLARQLADDLECQGKVVSGLGVGICELVDVEGRLASDNAIKWLDLPVRDELSAIAPVVLEADVRAAAVAEAWLGAARRVKNFLYVTVGTGISCCLMIDRKPYQGARGLTGTMASSALTLACEQCGHINGLTLEDVASGPGLVARFHAADGKAARAEEVLSAATTGDSVALRVVTGAAKTLGSQIGLLVNTLDPEAVIIGGGLGLSGSYFWDNLVISTRSHIWSARHRDLPIVRAETGSNAGWIGAALSAANRFEPGLITINTS